MSKELSKHRFKIRWLLVFYDTVIFVIAAILLLVIYRGSAYMTTQNKWLQIILAYSFLMISRAIFGVYRLVWRYGGIQSYIRLIIADSVAFLAFIALRLTRLQRMTAVTTISMFTITMLGCLVIRMIYRYAYKFGKQDNSFGWMLRSIYHVFSGNSMDASAGIGANKINVAIVGAGRIGTNLATDLTGNLNSAYIPRCFVDVSKEKTGRDIFGIPVLMESEATDHKLADLDIQEVVIAIANASPEEKRKLYDHYKQKGFKVKVYDYPTLRTAGSKMALREFEADELLFRREVNVLDEKVAAFYKGKTVLVTGGGGSIGSELCRQLARMALNRLVILDICENGAYEVQQDIAIDKEIKTPVSIEIISICNREALKRVFETYHPQIVIHAAAHKHVPLMEHNCIEAVENNIFGTLNVVELCEEFGSERFMMVSTDKAVNPTNVMGATKRMCEMIVQAHSQSGCKTCFSATRFGNVLGSAGSVIPLFKKQIASGGPITLTDRRIIRYFMTIPEASSLVLQSGSMAKNGELFVLDMGQPVKILDLAENLIRLSGLTPYQDIDIVETGLRPGEKLYEELLVKDENLGRTDNNLILIEKDEPLSLSEIDSKLFVLKKAITSGEDLAVKAALKDVVDTYREPEEVNAMAEKSVEFDNLKSFA